MDAKGTVDIICGFNGFDCDSLTNRNKVDILNQIILEKQNLIATNDIGNISSKSFSNMRGLSDVKIESVIATTHLQTEIDLKTLFVNCKMATFERKASVCLSLDISYPSSKLRIFSSGKIVSFGTKSIRDAYLSINNCIFIMKACEIQIPTERCTVKIAHLIGICVFNFNVGIKGIQKCLPQANELKSPRNTLHYKMLEPKITVIIYSTGKTKLMGCKSEDEFYLAVKKLYHIFHSNNVIGEYISKQERE